MSTVFPGPEWGPPTGTQVSDFEDNFQRADATTLGTAWGMAWQMADGPEDAIDRPRPYDSAANPAIVNNRLQWGSRRGVVTNGTADLNSEIPNCYSFAWPWQLGWMTQGRFDQYAEMTVEYWEPSGNVGLYIGTVFNQASGSMDPDVYGDSSGALNAQYGTYYGAAHTVIYGVFGANPSGTGGALRGLAGFGYSKLIEEPLPPGIGVFPQTHRLEARWLGTAWEMRTFFNGIPQPSTTIQDSRLLQGMPCIGVSCYPLMAVATLDSGTLGIISNFKAGLLV